MDSEIRKVRTVAQGRKQLVREREASSQLMQQGLSNNEACRIVGIRGPLGDSERRGRVVRSRAGQRAQRLGQPRRLPRVLQPVPFGPAAVLSAGRADVPFEPFSEVGQTPQPDRLEKLPSIELPEPVQAEPQPNQPEAFAG